MGILIDMDWFTKLSTSIRSSAVFIGLLQLFVEQCILYTIPLHMEFEKKSGKSIGSRSAL